MYTRYVELREAKGVNDFAVSKATGIPSSTFSDWKNGRSKPKIEKLIKIAAFFEIPVDELIRGD